MNRFAATVALSLLLGSMLVPAHAQDRGRGAVYVPDSSLEAPGDHGLFAHTNHRQMIQPDGGLDPSGGMTPDQMRGFYNLPSGNDQGHDVIAIVDAFDYPTALRDFNVFADHFKLPRESSSNVLSSGNKVFQVVYQGGRKPRGNTGWAQESALDVQWAHALAPKAKIVLFEAQSNSFGNLMATVDLARNFPGVKQISMSWGGSEFSSESTYDSHFSSADGPLFFAASGDTGGKTIYPSASPYVVAVGGTSVATDAAGNFTGETGWSGSGGGPSQYENKPGWQSGLSDTGATRCIPDLSSNSDPATGVAVYAPLNSKSSGWVVFGGTSVATPCIAAMVNAGGMTYANTTDFLTSVYAGMGGPDFRDILGGTAGSYSCQGGWDFVTGVGSPQGTGF